MDPVHAVEQGVPRNTLFTPGSAISRILETAACEGGTGMDRADS